VYSTIAVGTDGSETAAEAIRQAADLAKRYDAKLVLLSAFKEAPPADASDETQWAHNPAAQTREILTRAENDLSDEGIDCRTIVDEGDPADVLIKLADECNADLLVIGNKGHQRRVLGSVPREVVQHADCSVFVVKTT
jgi:nucleotide-binding universal stress UspA family protein